MKRIARRLSVTFVALLIMLVVGLQILKRMLPSEGGTDSDRFLLRVIQDGEVFRSTADALEDASMLVVSGGGVLDLRDARLAPGARLSVRTVFGGTRVIVPAGWRIELKPRGIGGRCVNNTVEPADPDAPILHVEALAVFGAIELGHRAGSPAAEAAIAAVELAAER